MAAYLFALLNAYKDKNKRGKGGGRSNVLLHMFIIKTSAYFLFVARGCPLTALAPSGSFEHAPSQWNSIQPNHCVFRGIAFAHEIITQEFHVLVRTHKLYMLYPR